MVSAISSMSFARNSISKRFRNFSWNSSLFCIITSIFLGFPDLTILLLSSLMLSLIVPLTNLWSLPTFTLWMTSTFQTMFLLHRMKSISFFVTPFGLLFHVHFLLFFFLKWVLLILKFLDIENYTSLVPCSLRSSGQSEVSNGFSVALAVLPNLCIEVTHDDLVATFVSFQYLCNFFIQFFNLIISVFRCWCVHLYHLYLVLFVDLYCNWCHSTVSSLVLYDSVLDALVDHETDSSNRLLSSSGVQHMSTLQLF